MDVVAVVLALLGFVFGLIALVGLIAPSLFKNKKTGEVPPRLQLFLGGTLLSFVLLLIAGSLMPQPAPQAGPAPTLEVAAVAPATAPALPVSSPDTADEPVTRAPLAEEEAAVQPAEPAQTEGKAVEHATLGVKPAEFAKRFDAQMAKQVEPWRIKRLRIENGAVNDTFLHSFNDLIAMSGGVAKNGEMTSVMIFANGDGTPQSGANIMLVVGAVYAAVHGVEIKAVGKEVGAVIKAQGEKGSASRILNGIKLSFSRSETLGNFFVVEPASQ